MGRKFIGAQVKPEQPPQRFYTITGPLFEGPGLTLEEAADHLHLLVGAAGLIGLELSAVAVVECDIDGQPLNEVIHMSDEVMARTMGMIVEGPDDQAPEL